VPLLPSAWRQPREDDMSFLDRIKGIPNARTADRTADGQATDELPRPANAMEATVRLGQSTLSPPDSHAGEDGSIISRGSPSGLTGDFGDSRMPDLGAEPTVFNSGLPILGVWPIARQQRTLALLFAAGLLGLLAWGAWSLAASGRSTGQVGAAAQAATHSQRLAKSMSQALVGNALAFAEVKDSVTVLAHNVRALKDGASDIAAAPAGLQEEVDKLLPLVERAEKSSATVLGLQKTLTQVGQALRAINRQSADLLETAETVSSLKLQGGASAGELSAVGQLVMLTQRIGKSANEFLTNEGVSAEAVFLLGKDLNTFREITQGVINGSAELRLPGTRDAQQREKLQQLMAQYEQTRTEASAILSNLQGLVAAREAQAQVVTDSEPLRLGLDNLQKELGAGGGLGGGRVGFGALALLALLAGGLGLLKLFVIDQQGRMQDADVLRLEAERQEQEAKRVNDANQAAILRLMNELQSVAEGDLTQQATVTEDITGAIADSVNYTVEELRTLVAQVQSTVGRVTDTTARVEATSTELLAASGEQLREIRDTGDSVLKMAGRINDVSAQAQETAQVARQSLQAAETGLTAVQNAIGGMNTIRDQIQAASAGEAGRGFSVVAEEVQRLAERSGDATRQIAAIVRTIQTDTQDAVGAMERSTRGVVEGARLSDAAGTALGDIDRVTRELSELIRRISNEALREAESANVVAANIQHIFAVTEQTSEGTRSTAQMVRELALTAEELKTSVSRFKIG
jgi:twitching motility protein PilJ